MASASVVTRFSKRSPSICDHSSAGSDIVTLYEQRRVHHVDLHQRLEEQMCQWELGVGDPPNRVDALVWAVTELISGAVAQPARWIRSPISLGR